MKLLLDTCTFLWLNNDKSRLTARALQICADEGNELYLSAVSAWEISAKHHAGKLPLPVPVEEFITNSRAANGISGLRFREEDAFYLAKLPALHKDPFDRMLICQAIARGMTIVTPDEHITQYPVPTAW